MTKCHDGFKNWINNMSLEERRDLVDLNYSKIQQYALVIRERIVV